jgi:hypothetical protein
VQGTTDSTFRVSIVSTMKGTAGYNNGLEGTTILRVEATNPEDTASVATPTTATFNLVITPDCTQETIDFPTAVSPTSPITYVTHASPLSIPLNDWTYRASCGVVYFLYCKCNGDPHNPYTSPAAGFSWPVKAYTYTHSGSTWTVTGDVATSNAPLNTDAELISIIGDGLVAFNPSTRVMTISYTANNKYSGSTAIELELWATNSAGITPVSQTLSFTVTEDCTSRTLSYRGADDTIANQLNYKYIVN